MVKDKQKEYMVQARLDLFVGITVSAVSLEDALAKSRDLKETDFVTVDGESLAGNMRLTGVCEVMAEI